MFCVVLFNYPFPLGSAGLTCLTLQPELAMGSQQNSSCPLPYISRQQGFVAPSLGNPQHLSLALGCPHLAPLNSELPRALGTGL